MANLSEQDVRAIIRDEIAKAFGINQNPDIKYLSTKEAASVLGYKNPQPLYKLINNGILRIGKEVQDRRSPNSVYADYWFNIPACQKRLNTPPEKRA